MDFATAETTNYLSLGLVLLTGLYSLLTYGMVSKTGQMVEQMKAQHDAFISPAITASIQIRHSNMVCLKITNRGQSAATNLRLSIDRDFYQLASKSNDRNLREFNLFKYPISSFSPGEELFIWLAEGFNLGKSVEDRVVTPFEFQIDATFEYAGLKRNVKLGVDLRPYVGTTQDKGEVVDQLIKIAKALNDRTM